MGAVCSTRLVTILRAERVNGRVHPRVHRAPRVAPGSGRPPTSLAGHGSSRPARDCCPRPSPGISTSHDAPHPRSRAWTVAFSPYGPKRANPGSTRGSGGNGTPTAGKAAPRCFSLRGTAGAPYRASPVFLVSGTRCSGASLWMQVLEAAGVRVLGKSPPRQPGVNGSVRPSPDSAAPETEPAPDPEDAYDSFLRTGIYYRTNPHPVTGRYFVPDDVRGCAVKVATLGVVRTEGGYIEKLVANVLDWREYEATLSRLEARQDEARAREDPTAVPRFRFPPAYQWWMENFALIRDIGLRRYPARLQTCTQIRENPVERIDQTLRWLGLSTAFDPKWVDVHEHLPEPEEAPYSDVIEPDIEQVFDDLYAAIDAGTPLSSTLLAKLYETNAELMPRLRELKRWVSLEAASTGAKTPEP